MRDSRIHLETRFLCNCLCPMNVDPSKSLCGLLLVVSRISQGIPESKAIGIRLALPLKSSMFVMLFTRVISTFFGLANPKPKGIECIRASILDLNNKPVRTFCYPHLLISAFSIPFHNVPTLGYRFHFSSSHPSTIQHVWSRCYCRCHRYCHLPVAVVY